MRLLLASDTGSGALQLALAGAGVVLLAVWLFFLARGRNLLVRGPEPVAGFPVLDAAAALALWLGVQVVTLVLADALGVPEGTDRNLVVKLGELAAVVLILLAWIARNPAHGPRARGAASGALACVGVLPVVWAVLLATRLAYDAAGHPWEEQEILVTLRGAAAWKFVLVGAILAPLTEEVVFRGVVHPTLKRLGGRWLGVLGSAGLFMIVHPEMQVWPAIFVLGVALALVYERTGTLAAPIAFHAVFNGITVVGEFLKQAG